MPSCVFRFCNNYSRKLTRIDGVTYHSFPVSQKSCFRTWVDIVRQQRSDVNWIPSTTCKICSIHFKDEDKYVSKKGNVMLKKGALPFFEKTTPDLSTRVRSWDLLLHEECSKESVVNIPGKATSKKCVRKLRIDMENLKNQNRKLYGKVKLSKKKVASMSNILKLLRKRDFISEEMFNELNVCPEVLNLLDKCIDKKTGSIKSLRFPPVLRKFVLTFNFHSPAAYKHVRRVFHTALPHPRIIGKWYENYSISPGLTSQAFDILKKKFKKSGERMICTLMVAEMALRHVSKWTGGKTEGLVDFGGMNYNKVIATDAYVLLLVSMNESWKLPVGYFFVKNVREETRAHLINSSLRKCYHSGVDVVALTLNASQNNFSTAKFLGCNLEDPENLKTTFKHPECDQEVALLFDPCHLIQLVRNTFESIGDIFCEDQEIKWQILMNLHKLQMNEKLNYVNKVSERQILFRNEIVKVQLATQQFSKSIANTLELCEQLLVSSEFTNSAGTIEFINIFNDLFDILNSKDNHGLGFEKSITQQNSGDIINFLDKAKQYILSLKTQNKTKTVLKHQIIHKVIEKRLIDSKCSKGFLGFLICIESLKHLYFSLVEIQQNLKSISTYRLSQDHIKILFGTDLKHEDDDNNPNVTQFKDKYKKLLNHLELRSEIIGNCIPIEQVPILNASSAILNINRTCSQRILIDENEDYETEDTRNNEIKMTSDKVAYNNVKIFVGILDDQLLLTDTKLIVGYISGRIAKKLINILKCDVCVNSLVSNKKEWFHKLISFKDMGGICYSSQNLFSVCFETEKVIKIHLKVNGMLSTRANDIKLLKIRIMKIFINSDIFSSLNSHASIQPPMFNHRLHLIRAIIDEYLTVRLHSYTLRRNNPVNRTILKLF